MEYPALCATYNQGSYPFQSYSSFQIFLKDNGIPETSLHWCHDPETVYYAVPEEIQNKLEFLATFDVLKYKHRAWILFSWDFPNEVFAAPIPHYHHPDLELVEELTPFLPFPNPGTTLWETQRDLTVTITNPNARQDTVNLEFREIPTALAKSLLQILRQEIPPLKISA